VSLAPWKETSWVTNLPIDECLARVRVAGRRDFLGGGAIPRKLERVVLLGRTFRLEYTGRWPGRPHLHGMFVRASDKTVIVGRFIPDPFVLAAAVLMLWALIAVGLSTASYGPGRVLKTLGHIGNQTGGAPIVVLLSSLVLTAIVRILGWSRQCEAMSRAVATLFDATPRRADL
jgi:hypothetical protein